MAGVRFWAANPIDALPPGRQAAYLDFLAYPARFATPTEHAPQVVVLRGEQQPPAWIGARYRLEAQSGPYVVYSRPR